MTDILSNLPIPKMHHGHAEREHSHDVTNCPICFRDEKILRALEVIAATEQMMLRRLDTLAGIPKGVPMVAWKLSAAQNTVYSSGPAPVDGTLRNMMLSGRGNVTVTINSSAISGGVNGVITLGPFFCSVNNTPIPLNFNIPCPVGATIGVSTDDNSGNPVGVTAWLEPSPMTESELYRMRRG